MAEYREVNESKYVKNITKIKQTNYHIDMVIQRNCSVIKAKKQILQAIQLNSKNGCKYAYYIHYWADRDIKI